MTVAPPSYTHQSTLSSGSHQKTHHAGMPRRGSLQEAMWMANNGSNVPSRSSLSSLAKTKSMSSPSLIVVVDSQKATADNAPGPQHVFPPSAHSDCFLQSADKRRRYHRRGSKTSYMMKVSCKIDLPVEWQATLANAISKPGRVINSSSFKRDDSGMLCPGTMATAASLFSHLRSQSKGTMGGNESSSAIRRQSTVSLLTTALELSRIEGQRREQD